MTICNNSYDIEGGDMMIMMAAKKNVFDFDTFVYGINISYLCKICVFDLSRTSFMSLLRNIF